MATPGEKARDLVHGEVGDKTILAEIAGNNRYLVLLADEVLVGSKGLASGSFFGEKVKHYPLGSISTVDVRKALLTAELEIISAGSIDSGHVGASFTQRAQNENITAFDKNDLPAVRDFAAAILEQKRKLSETAAAPTASADSDIPGQIKQLAELRDAGVLTDDEFETKKTELLARM